MKARKINLLLFSLFLVFLIALPPLFKDRFLSNAERPWQLLPFAADSLSDFYKEHYTIIKEGPLFTLFADTAKPTIMVLVDGWGVPYEEDSLASDFSYFSNTKANFGIYERFKNITSLAEREEYGKDFTGGLLLVNGDSTNCSKKQQNYKELFREIRCFVGFGGKETTSKLDSLTSIGEWKKTAWTAFDAREGDREKLHLLLESLSKLTKKYPEVQFIIQGTHRPILGSPETRRKYLAPWVPTVFLNGDIHITE